MAKPNTVFLPQDQLKEVIKKGPEWNFNRQWDQSLKVPKGTYPVAVAALHHHRNRVACETHVRILVTLNGAGDFVDVPWDFFQSLSRKQTKSPTEFSGVEEAFTKLHKSFFGIRLDLASHTMAMIGLLNDLNTEVFIQGERKRLLKLNSLLTTVLWVICDSRFESCFYL